MPDGVLTFQESNLVYCNQKTDNIFGVQLAGLSNIGDSDKLRSSEYLVMNNRCMHELKIVNTAEVAAKMMQ